MLPLPLRSCIPLATALPKYISTSLALKHNKPFSTPPPTSYYTFKKPPISYLHYRASHTFIMDANVAVEATSTKPAPWYAALPAPKNLQPDSITREELLHLLQAKDSSSAKKFLLVDVRRTDYEGGTIHGSINLPAQSLFHTIPRLYDLFAAAGIETVIWYCGSSRGRGSRAAGWFEDHIKSHGSSSKDMEMESVILLGGIAGWAAAGEGYVALMDDYSPEAWK